MKPATSLFLLMTACSGKGGDSGDADRWWTRTHDLGSERAAGSGYELSGGQAAWLAADQVVPGLGWDFPATAIPLYLWEEVAQGHNIADEGSCPYTVADIGEDKDTVTWKSDCRSQDGYEWTGSVSETTWHERDEDGVLWTRWDLDLEIVGDVDDPSFQVLALDGAMVFGQGDGERIVRSAQVNVRTHLDGFWEQRSVADEREEAWDALVVSGRWEARVEDGMQVDHMAGAVDLGSRGGLRFDTDGLRGVTSCAGEPRGTITLSAGSTAELAFNGDESCDRCAELYLDGERQGFACGS